MPIDKFLLGSQISLLKIIQNKKREMTFVIEAKRRISESVSSEKICENSLQGGVPSKFSGLVFTIFCIETNDLKEKF